MAGGSPADDAAYILETPRLLVRRLTLADADVIIDAFNTPGFLSFVGDRGMTSPEPAIKYLQEGPLSGYAERGYGAFCLVLRADPRVKVGICGPIYRPWLNEVEMGYSLTSAHQGAGYATEACAALLSWCHTHHKLTRLVAVIHPDNAPSIRVALKCGFRLEKKGLEASSPADMYAWEYNSLASTAIGPV